MSRMLSIREVCERALRRIGAYPIRSSGARPEEVDEARFWLDMIVGHMSSVMRTWWLVPGTGTFALAPGTPGYDLGEMLTSAQAPDGIQFVISVYLYDPVAKIDICEMRMLRRQEYEAIDDKSRIGEPEAIYIDRDDRPRATLYPVPDTARSYVVRVLFQGYSSDFTKNSGVDKTFTVRHSWNLWLVTALAAAIGNGPVRKQPADEVKDMKDEATRYLDQLQAYENTEQANEPRRVSYSNGI